MILIAGLGNPGNNYNNTRHNIGFTAVDTISDQYNLSWLSKSKFNSEISAGDCEIGKIILCKPNTFMNLSGSAVKSIARFYKIDLDKIIVIHDDIDLSLGKIKHKIGGSSGGHNGLKSINNLVGANYQRLRIGVGRPAHSNYQVSDYVLSKFDDDEKALLKDRLILLSQNLKLLISNDIEKFKAKIAL